MKKIAMGLVGLASLIAAPARAADMPVKYVAPPPVFSWTGCYIGVHVGAGWEVSSWTSSGDRNSGVGAVGGAQAGCNAQWRQFVIGLEGEFWASSLYDRDFTQNQFFTRDTIARNRWDGTLAVRSGLAFDRAFVYGKLGVAVGKFDYSSDSAGFGGTEDIRGSATIAGVLIGVGFEYALTDNWTTKFEYNYIDYGNKIVNFTDTNCDIGGCVTTTFSRTIKERKQLAKIGVNYKFGYDPPVIAKY
jgi:outer membrane immunogenic protein